MDASPDMNQPVESSNHAEPFILARDVDVYYGGKQALEKINLEIPSNQVTSLIGPSGCGKTTFLRCVNRMNDLIPTASITKGEIRILNTDIYDPDVDVIELRKHIGMVFQKYNPFPKSIYENVAYGLRIQGIRNKAVLDQAVEESLIAAGLLIS